MNELKTHANNKLIAKQIKEDYFSEDEMDLMVMLIDFQFRLEHVEGELKRLRKNEEEE